MSPTTGIRGSTDPGTNAWAGGLAIAAAVLMLTVGAFQVLEGLAALINGDFYVRIGNYAFDIDVTVWAWVHLVIGLVVAVVGGFILSGARWALNAGIGVAVLSAITNFVFIPYYPLWALLIIAFDFAVIWALAVYNPDE